MPKWPFKVTQGHPFRCQWKATKGLYRLVQYNNCGIACEGSEDIASERSENRHLRRPHIYLMPPIQRTPRNIFKNLTLLEIRIPGLHFCRWWSANFRQFCPKSRNASSLVAEPKTDFNAKWLFKVTQGHLFGCHWRATKGLHSAV